MLKNVDIQVENIMTVYKGNIKERIKNPPINDKLEDFINNDSPRFVIVQQDY